MSKRSPLEARFNRLLKRMCDGSVVPFVGAGISRQARINGDTHFKPTLKYMAETLNQEFKAKVKSEDPNCKQFQCALPENPEGSFERLAEVCEWLWGGKEVCSTIKIEKFARLEPTSAHRYLAYLAREELFTEIISTNYDCCIEIAFKASFAEDDADRDTTLAVIQNLGDYSRHGGRQYEGQFARPVLHLYKINGCAEKYAEKKDEDSAKRIILTERQLQNFRDERWARDLFRDRARRRNLLFCGFGSEEPQVRHTALELCDEFSGQSAKEKVPDPISDLCNAPFLAAYTTPTFPQLQILQAFVSSNCSPEEWNKAEAKDACFDNVFTGDDAPALGNVLQQLSGDLFFKCLYQLALCRLVFKETDRESVFHRWLSAQNLPAGHWCWYLRRKLFPLMVGDAVRSEQGRQCCPAAIMPAVDGSPEGGDLTGLPDGYFGTWPCLLEHGSKGPMVLWEWLWAMQYPFRQIPTGSNWYLPIGEDTLFILTTLMLLVCLNPCSFFPDAKEAFVCPMENIRVGAGLGLEVNVKKDDSETATNVYLVGSHAVHRICQRTDANIDPLVKEKRIFKCISVPSRKFWDSERLLKLKSDSGNDGHIHELWLSRQYCVAAEDLFRQAENPAEIPFVLKYVFARQKPGGAHVKLEPII
jgi:hypothetical protein